MKKIILNWMPPSMVEMPSPAMSVLKKYLKSQGFDVSIIYWNIKLFKIQSNFLWDTIRPGNSNELCSNLVFYNYLAIKYNDECAYSKVKSALMAIKPNYMTGDPHIYDNQMKTYAKILETFIETELKKIDFSNILFIGMSTNLYQWICSSIIAEKIKEINPNIPIIIGGIGTKESATDFLTNFNQFDIAIWGEGELILTEVAKYLNTENKYNCSITEIPHIAFRTEDGIKTSNGRLKQFADLNNDNTFPEFDDYFKQLSVLNDCDIRTYLYIEGSRSCHWKKCHFCYLNTGYKHRLKSPNIIDKQIREHIKRYNVFEFNFLDNDIISNDWERFSEILSILTSIREDYPKFKIILAEIITKDITADYIRRMALAGFCHVQIGYESPSNNILRKIEKKNTLASNLLFLKFAYEYNIFVNGANVIRGLLEETYEDITEAIENLRFMRFILGSKKFKHDMSNLGIMKSSRYYDKTKNDSTFELNEIVSYLPEKFIEKKSIYECNIVDKISKRIKPTWTFFNSVENFFITNSYTYKIYRQPNGFIYQEFFNNELINELEFDNKSIDYIILENSNRKVLRYEKLIQLLHNTNKYQFITDCEIYNTLEDLKNEGIIYTPSDYSEILTVIDIDKSL